MWSSVLRCAVGIFVICNASFGDGPAPPKKVVAPMGAKWEGTYGPNAKTQSAEVEVISRNGNKATLRLTLENEAVFDFDVKFSENQFSAVKIARVRPARGQNPNEVKPVGAGKASGKVSGDVLSLEYVGTDEIKRSFRTVQKK